MGALAPGAPCRRELGDCPRAHLFEFRNAKVEEKNKIMKKCFTLTKTAVKFSKFLVWLKSSCVHIAKKYSFFMKSVSLSPFDQNNLEKIFIFEKRLINSKVQMHVREQRAAVDRSS